MHSWLAVVLLLQSSFVLSVGSSSNKNNNNYYRYNELDYDAPTTTTTTTVAVVTPPVHRQLSSTSAVSRNNTLSLSDGEMRALEALYVKTNGKGWAWRSNYYDYGVPWNFSRSSSSSSSSSFLYNPCKDEWQVGFVIYKNIYTGLFY